MTVLVIVVVIAFLIFVNGLYVAAEFSTVSARRPRLAQMADEGDRVARFMLHVVEDPKRLDGYVAACQLGITVSSLVLGFYGQARFMALLAPWLSQLPGTAQALAQTVAATAVLLLLTILQVILGELVPKNIGLQYPEKLATLTAAPMRWSMAIFRPLVFVFNGSGQIILRLIGAEPVAEHSHIHSPEEILMLVEESSAGGLLDVEERRLLVNTLQLRDMTTRKVMVPRNRMITGSVDSGCAELFRQLANSAYSRLPLFDGTIDNIVGVVHLKDLMQVHRSDAGGAVTAEWAARTVMHDVLHVPDSVEIGEVMNLMQARHTNLVIVVDEFGGTAGMITFEDLIEEIIGEFEDEFDAENPAVQLLADGRVSVRGDVLIEDLNEALGLFLPLDDVNTVGGMVVKKMGRIPRKGATAEIAGMDVRIERVYRNGIAAVSFSVSPEQAAAIERLGEEY